MNTQSWTLKTGFITGATIIAVGVLLQLFIGPVAWDAFAWPINGVIMAAMVALIVLMHLTRDSIAVCRSLSTYQAAIPAIAYAVVLTIVMGLTRQTDGAPWLNDMLAFWPFVLIYAYMALIVGLVAVKQMAILFKTKLSWSSIAALPPSTLFHLGLFVTMTTATLGNADMQRVKMVVSVGQQEWRAMTAEGAVRQLPLTIELRRFLLEQYADGSPKRYASELTVITRDGRHVEATVDVNKPLRVDGWKIYQYGYDETKGAQSDISILELVSDPWLPLVYSGIYMMLAGAVVMFIVGARRRRV